MPIYHKYCPSKKHYFDILASRKIRVTQPAALNDPFEMSGRLSGEELLQFVHENPNEIPGLAGWVTADLDGAVAQLQATFAPINQQIVAQSGVICTSSAWDSPPMWAHYCDNHTGFVLGFDSNVGVFREMAAVRYADCPAGFEITPTRDSVEAIVFTKTKVWSYENEHRVVGLLSECEDTGKKDPNGHRIYLHELPEGCITEITLGARMARDHAEILSESAKALGVTVFRAVCDLESNRLVRTA
jgi:hypothetical protein